jgi:hypothetical protein
MKVSKVSKYIRDKLMKVSKVIKYIIRDKLIWPPIVHNNLVKFSLFLVLMGHIALQFSPENHSILLVRC